MSIRYYVMRVSVDPSRNVDEANFGQSSVIDLDNPTNAATVGGVASFNLPTANGIEVFAHVMDAQLAQSYIENARKITRSFLLEKGRIHLNPNASASQKNAVGYWINQAWEGFFSYFSAANVCARSWEKLRKVLEYNWLTQPSEQNNFLPGCFFYRQENSSRAGLLSTLGEVRCDFSMKKYMGIQNGLWRSMIFKSIREQNLLGGRNNVTRIRFGADENYRLGAWTNRLRPQQFTECPAYHCDWNVTSNGYVDNRIWDYASAGIDAGAGTTPIAPTGDFHPIFVNYTNRVCSSILKDSRQYNTSSSEWKFETKPQITELFNDGGPQRYFRSDSQVRFPQIDQEAIPFITTGYVGYRANPWEDDSPTAYCWVPLIWYYDLLFSPIPGLTLNGSNDDIYSPSAITAAAGGTRFLSLAEYLEQKGVEKIVQEIRRDCMFANMKIKAYFRWTDEDIATKMFGGEREIMRSQLDIYRQQNAPLNVISTINSSLRGQTNTNPVSAGLAIVAGAAEIVMRTIDFFNKASAASSLRNQWQRDVFGQPLCADVNIGQTTPPIDSQYVPSVRSFKPLYLSSYSPEEFENIIKNCQCETAFSEFQKIFCSYKNTPINIVVTTLVFVEDQNMLSFDIFQTYEKYSGIMKDTTKFIFEATDKNIKLINSNASIGNKLFKKELDLKELGIGGLDSQFTKIFRSAFASRVVPKQIATKMNLEHRKGVLLYGPPGTGKTLIARKIGELLNCKSIKVISGPEVLNQYVGGSEQNIRKLFADAEFDKSVGDESLHLIIFDEADALFKKRGSRNDSTGVSENVVNQILSKIDGVDQLNNILIIAMTNRKDSIDEAILRSGRLDIHIEVGLPNESGRYDILNIHTSKLKDRLNNDVNLNEIARITKNYTGAELKNIVTSATSFAITRGLDMNDLKNVEIDPIISQEDFLNAIDDVPTLYGKISEEINLITHEPFIQWSESINQMQELIISLMSSLSVGNNMSILISGSTGIGKTKFLSHIIKDSNISCVKMISPEILLRTNNIQDKLTESIDACSRADTSILFIDGFERLIKWSKYGYRYDNDALQSIMAILRMAQYANKKMFIFCTANNTEVLHELEIYEMFDYCYEYPEAITNTEVSLNFPQIMPLLETTSDSFNISKILKMTKHY